jgi:hypothetical protein
VAVRGQRAKTLKDPHPPHHDKVVTPKGVLSVFKLMLI